MPAPKKPSTSAATAAVVRRGDETAAGRLRDHGWIVISPEQASQLPAAIRERLNAKEPTMTSQNTVTNEQFANALTRAEEKARFEGRAYGAASAARLMEMFPLDVRRGMPDDKYQALSGEAVENALYRLPQVRDLVHERLFGDQQEFGPGGSSMTLVPAGYALTDLSDERAGKLEAVIIEALRTGARRGFAEALREVRAGEEPEILSA